MNNKLVTGIYAVAGIVVLLAAGRQSNDLSRQAALPTPQGCPTLGGTG